MKVPFDTGKFFVRVLCAGALASSLMPALGAKSQRPQLPDVDQRVAVAPDAARMAERAAAVAGLRSYLGGARVDFDRLIETPRFIHTREGFLTGAGGVGGAVRLTTAQEFSTTDPHRAVKAFLNEHKALVGVGAADLAGAIISRESVAAHNGLRTVVWQQQLDGIPVFESVLIGNITPSGQLVTLASRFLKNPAALADAGAPNRAQLQAQPPVTMTAAILKAAENIGDALAMGEITADGEGVQGAGYRRYHAGQRWAAARQVWLPMNRAALRPAWEVVIHAQTGPGLYQVLIDAETGDVVARRGLTRDISNASYNIFPSDSPSPFSPGWPSPNNTQPAVTNRTLVTLAALDPVASPNGWINDGDNDTRGNNADTYLDRDGNFQPDVPRPVGNPNRVFNPPLDLAQPPDTYAAASTVNLFYHINWYHDRLYELGFTESAGNFQNNNFGRGGAGNDRIWGRVQADANFGTANNASFATPPDGFNGTMNMYIWDGPNPDRDGSLDAEVVYHEATHGTSTRLVGGGVGISAMQTGGMGEGWSDFYGTSLLSAPGDDPDAVYAMGGYVTYQYSGSELNYYYGIRRYPYSTDMTKSPLTFKDIDPTQTTDHAGVPRNPTDPFDPAEAAEEHNQGEVWCVMLWEARANLVRRYGYAGNQLMMQLVTDGMKLAPANPTFVEARDAIILADLVNTGGANTSDLWSAFAKRGMGFSAVAPPADTTIGVIEAYDVPGLLVETLTVMAGNGNGIVDVNECNNLQIVLRNNLGVDATGVSVTLSTTTPGAALGVRTSAYPDVPNGLTATNAVPFQLSTSPAFACGLPITLDVVVKTDQGTRTNVYVLSTGSLGAAVRYDSAAGAVAIPDNDPAGAVSPVGVTNWTGVLGKVAVSLFLTHSYDSDLRLEMEGPDGVVVPLSINHGGSGNNYGSGCTPDVSRTTFDDSAATAISAGTAPFLGSYRPETPLTVYVGKTGTNVNGLWKLRVVDSVTPDTGAIQCWSLWLTPTVCLDGGGTCPGADLSLGIKALPEPVFLGSNLVYTISVTNRGPSEAKNTVVNQFLPLSVVPQSAVASQGSASFSGNTMIGNLGTVGIGGVATVTVTVTPALAGTIVSSATVSSSDSDPDVVNNSANVTTHVNPPSADLVVTVGDSPDPAIVGASVTYLVTVTNLGPSGASVVKVTNVVTSGLVISGASASQGSATINGNSVVAQLGSVPNGGGATISVTAVATAVGAVGMTAQAASAQADPIAGNNIASATTTVGPAANLGLTLTDLPDPVVVRSNWTYFMVVTNAGPSAAGSVVVNANLPANVSVVGSGASQGSVGVVSGVVTANLGNVLAGGSASVTVTVNATNSGIYSASASVTGNAADPASGNNSAAATTTVSPPIVTIAAAGATLTAESVSPANGGVDIGETVTVTLRLRNAGNVVNTNLMATLQSSGGVNSPVPGSAVSYGVLTPSGQPEGRSFTFNASGSPGGTVTATLQLTDGGNALPPVNFSFTLPTVKTFANTNFISITDNQPIPWLAGPASPYPSTNFVSGVTGLVGKVTVTLSNLNHTFPDDIDVLLVSPGGQKAVLLSDAGGGDGVNNVNVTLDDSAGTALPNGGALATGSYQPGNHEAGDTFNGPAPAGPYGSTLGAFAGQSPNGTWQLFIMDDSTGDPGNVAKGWSLAFSVVSPVNQIADLGLAAVASPNPALQGGAVVCTYTVTNTGPNAATGVGFTNDVPGGALLLGAVSSQGGVVTNGNTATASLGTINAGGVATVTVTIQPVATGVLNSPASVGASENDLNPANNEAIASVNVNLPVADAGVSQSATNGPGGDVTFIITATNQGPQSALNVLLTDPLPAGLSYVASSGVNVTNSGGVVTIGLGNLLAGASSTVTVTATGVGTGLKTNVVAVSTVSADTNAVNNAASVILQPAIAPAGAVLMAESSPANGAVDSGETVTVALSLQNLGIADTANLVATLQASGGVTPITTSQNYGGVLRGGPAVARNFTFTANGPNGGVVIATLQLQDGADNLGTAVFVFQLATTATYASPAAIVIPDHGPASPYPSTIEVAGLTGLLSQATVTLSGLTHGFPDDVDVLLVGPTGQKLVLMSDAGGGHSISNLTLTFSDAGGVLPDSATLATASYAAADYEPGEPLPAPAPGGASAAALNAFNGSNPNGTWSLYVADDATGDAGTIANGWSLTLTTVSTVNPVADLELTMTDTPDPVLVGNGLTYTITVMNHGPQTATGVLVNDTLPAGLTLHNTTATQGSVTNLGQAVTGVLGDLASGASAVLTLRVSSAAGGGVLNSATVTGGETDLNPGNNTAQTATAVTVPLAVTLTEVEISGGQLQFTVSGQPNTGYTIQSSPDLSGWSPVSTQTTAGNGQFKFTDPTPPTQGERYYRAVRVLE